MIAQGNGDLIQQVTINQNSGTDLVLSAGDVAAEGTGTAANLVGTYAQTGGELKGSGLLTITTAASWTGGTMDGTGVTQVDDGLVISGAVTLSDRTLENAGSGTWNGTIGGSNGTLDNQASGTFAGAGSFTGNLSNEGQLLPGGAGTPGTIALGGNFTQAGGTLVLDLGSPGSGSDALTVAGTVTLGGTLSLNPLSGAGSGPYTLIANTGGSPINGIFQGLSEGQVFSAGGTYYQISYQGGAGNDVVIQAPVTTTTLYLSTTTVAFGNSVDLHASVQPTGIGGGPPLGGTVTFYADGTALGTAPIAMMGYADLSVSTLAVGGHTITAVYNGDGVYATSTSEAASVTVVQDTPFIMPNGPGWVQAGQSFTLSAFLCNASSVAATGAVTFTLVDAGGNQTSLGSGTLDGMGNAGISASVATAGSYTIVVSYGGDVNDAACSVTLSLNVYS